MSSIANNGLAADIYESNQLIAMVSSQLTKTVFDHLQNERDKSVFGYRQHVGISAPPFNIKNASAEWMQNNVLYRKYNIPVYGIRLQEAIYDLYQLPALQEELKAIHCPMPKWHVDKFVQKKMDKVQPVVDELKARQCDEAATKLEQFIQAFRDVKDINSLSEWTQFLLQFIVRKNWQESLHARDVLSLFGVPKQISDEICDIDVPNSDGSSQTLEHRCVRWISKAVSGFKLNGCLTDVVNGIAILMGYISGEITDEPQAFNMVRCFAKAIKDDQLTIVSEMPRILIHDSEFDDLLLWALLRYLSQTLNMKLTVIVQVNDEQGPDIHQHYQNMINQGMNIQILVDHESKNSEAIRTSLGLPN